MALPEGRKAHVAPSVSALPKRVMAAATLAKMVVGRRMRLGGEGGGEGGDGEGGEGGGAGQSETVPTTSKPLQVGDIRQEQTVPPLSTLTSRPWAGSGKRKVTVVTTMQGWHVNFFTPRGCWEILSVSTHKISCVARDGAR